MSIDIQQARRNVARRFSHDTLCSIHKEPLWDASSQSVDRGYVCIKCEIDKAEKQRMLMQEAVRDFHARAILFSAAFLNAAKS